MAGGPIVYSVTVPIYNSAPVVPSLYRRLVGALERLGERFEVIFVNDASTDRTWSVLSSIAQQDLIVAIQLTRNVGQGLATLVGISRSAGEILITLDDDLQHLPEEFQSLLRS